MKKITKPHKRGCEAEPTQPYADPDCTCGQGRERQAMMRLLERAEEYR